MLSIRSIKVLLFVQLLMSFVFYTPLVLAVKELPDLAKEGYSEEEVNQIEREFRLIYNEKKQRLDKLNIPYYLASIGGPGSGKSKRLEEVYLHSVVEHQSYSGKSQNSIFEHQLTVRVFPQELEKPTKINCIYLDPDRQGLLLMKSYLSEMVDINDRFKGKGVDEIKKYREKFDEFRSKYMKKHDFEKLTQAYTKWRVASNYITNKMYNEAVNNKWNIVHGTTLTGDTVPRDLEELKDANYKIYIVMCLASEKTRRVFNERQRNEEKFYQCTENDFIRKPLLVPQCFPVYLKWADVIFLHFSDSEEAENYEAIGYIRLDTKCLEVSNHEKYKKFVNEYDTLAGIGSSATTKWEECLEKASIAKTHSMTVYSSKP